MTKQEILARFPQASEAFIAANLGAGPWIPPLVAEVVEAVPLDNLAGIKWKIGGVQDFKVAENAPLVKTFQARMIAIGAPRMTRADAWKKRPPVLRYFAAKAKLREFVPAQACPDEFHWVARIPMPETWKKAKKRSMDGKPHRQKPDRDNVDKWLCDGIFSEDKGIWCGSQKKFWCVAGMEKIEMTLVYHR